MCRCECDHASRDSGDDHKVHGRPSEDISTERWTHTRGDQVVLCSGWKGSLEVWDALWSVWHADY